MALPPISPALGITGAEYAAAVRDSFASPTGFSFGLLGGEEEISTGYAGIVEVPYACEIKRVTALSPDVGSIVVDIWKSSYAAFPPTDANSITASAPVTLSSARKSQNATLTGWSKTLAAGDILMFNVDSVSGINNLSISFTVERL